MDKLNSRVILIRETGYLNFVILDINESIYIGHPNDVLKPVMFKIDDTEFNLNVENVRRFIIYESPKNLLDFRKKLKQSLFSELIHGNLSMLEVDHIINSMECYFDDVFEDWEKTK